MLSSKNPNVLDWSRYLERFSQYEGVHAAPFTTEKKFRKMGATPGEWNKLGPGQYKMMVNRVIDPRTEIDITGIMAADRREHKIPNTGHEFKYEISDNPPVGTYNPPIDFCGKDMGLGSAYPNAGMISFTRGAKFKNPPFKNRHATEAPGPGYYKLRGFFETEDNLKSLNKQLKQRVVHTHCSYEFAKFNRCNQPGNLKKEFEAANPGGKGKIRMTPHKQFGKHYQSI